VQGCLTRGGSSGKERTSGTNAGEQQGYRQTGQYWSGVVCEVMGTLQVVPTSRTPEDSWAGQEFPEETPEALREGKYYDVPQGPSRCPRAQVHSRWSSNSERKKESRKALLVGKKMTIRERAVGYETASHSELQKNGPG